MTKEVKSDKSGRQNIGQDIAKSISEATNLPVYYIDNKIPIGVAEIFIKEAPALLNHLSKEDIYAEVQGAYSSYFMDAMQIKDPDERILFMAEKFDKLLKSLQKGKTCTAFVFIPSIGKLPVGTTLGSAEIIDRESVKFEHDNSFWQHADHLKKEFNNINYDSGGTWLKCEFKSYLNNNIRNDFYPYIQPIIGILSTLLYGHRISEKTLIGVILHDKRQSYLGPDALGKNYLTNGWAIFDQRTKDRLVNVSRILGQKKPSEIEKKIVLSSKLFNLGAETSSNEASFITTMSAIEGLLLTKSDRDFLGHKLSEKTSFLLRKKQSDRIGMYEEMKRLYDLRSNLVHGSAKSSKITSRDVKDLENIYLSLFEVILSLSKKMKTATEFDQYINRKRFA